MSRYLLPVLFVVAIGFASLHAADQDLATATIELTMPPKAKLFLGTQLIRSTPGTHRMETPPLEKGKDYSYTFRVEIERDGKTVSFTKKIPVEAGKTAKVDFTKLLKELAEKPVPEKPVPAPVDEFKMTDLERAVLDRTNAERKMKELPELKPNPKLFVAARKHSENMARLDELEHELEGKKVSDRVKDAGYRGSYVGENIAAGQIAAAEVVKGWMDSDGHRTNILSKNYTEIGIGVGKSAKGTLFFTQVFARPR